MRLVAVILLVAVMVVVLVAGCESWFGVTPQTQ